MVMKTWTGLKLEPYSVVIDGPLGSVIVENFLSNSWLREVSFLEYWLLHRLDLVAKFGWSGWSGLFNCMDESTGPHNEDQKYYR
jgi:hypothetical protein